MGGTKSKKTKVHVQYCYMYNGVPSGGFNGQNDALLKVEKVLVPIEGVIGKHERTGPHDNL